jgi:aryl-alcohol dehydrogenase-like predicted oxidoreductase
VLAQGEDIIPIPGTRREKYLRDNIGATEITLSPEELTELDTLLPPGAAVGTRYPEQFMSRLGI